jgi:hypothetical protein
MSIKRPWNIAHNWRTIYMRELVLRFGWIYLSFRNKILSWFWCLVYCVTPFGQFCSIYLMDPRHFARFVSAYVKLGRSIWFLAGYWGALRTTLVIGPSIFCKMGFGLVVSIVVPLMLAVLPYARGRGFESRSRLLYIVWTYLCFSSFISLYIVHCTSN